MKYLFLKLLSFFYGMVAGLRNELFNLKILSSREFDLPVISVGNITAGGTGKTPHTEYIAGLLKPNFKVAILSRGYKRKTRGFYIVETTSKVRQVGDEPLQIKLKFNELTVTVDANRVRGIEKLLTLPQKPDVILLDDAFQHRYVAPGINILLTDYNHLITKDSLLPYGRLRESASNKSRASIIIVTKCPAELKPIDERIITKELEIKPYQNLYFSKIEYGSLMPVFPADVSSQSVVLVEGLTILMVTGIANPSPLKDYLKHGSHDIHEMNFPDHHQYKLKDLDRIIIKFESLTSGRKIIVTTEKDMVRFRDFGTVSEIIRKNMYYIPLKISFLNNTGKEFDRKILNYVKENKRNFKLYS
ncbi:MAG: tetraacyldisaccharide 4'-kinase [Bacteroidia bacterium]|nr:tetraacyldisaccharide 4'-kinase [Bacteroidia bacterium]